MSGIMDKLFLIIAFISISDGGSEAVRYHYRSRHHCRSRARHVLVQNLGMPVVTDTPPTTIIRSTTQLLTTTSQQPTTASTTQPTPSTTTPSEQDENDPSDTRRGSQQPDSYTEDEWELIQQRIENPPPGGSFDSSPDHDSIPDDQQPQDGQDTPPTQRSEVQGQTEGQDPFLNRMSAMDYLTRRAQGNILTSRSNRQNREFSREMGEQMCEAFGKHYVSISIGGKCV